MDSGLIAVTALGGVLLLVIVIYNRLVALRQTRLNAFADIEVQLNMRHDLIPNLVETVKGYASHEKGLLENVTQARSQAMQARNVNDKIGAEAALGGALMNLLAVAENYPDLKANENFGRLQSELSDIENKIAAARRFFNNATNEYNTGIEQFPAVILARMFGFGKEQFFEIDQAKREQIAAAPQVKF